MDRRRIVTWEVPVSKQQVLERLVAAVAGASPEVSTQGALEGLMARERQGSMYLNEGVALPHARVAGVTRSQVALGLTHAGVLDAPAENPTEVVLLLLSSPEDARVHLQLLGAAARTLQSQDLRRGLSRAGSPEEALSEIRGWESVRGMRDEG